MGIPARYGGFETLAQALAEHTPADQMRLVFYCQKSAYGEDERQAELLGHRRVFLPLPANGMSSILYDAVSILDAVMLRRCRVLLCLGASATGLFPLLKLFSPNSRLIFNLDGLESRRAKWSLTAKIVLRVLEYIGVKLADNVVTDNRVIRSLVSRRFHRSSTVIAYGGDHARPDRISQVDAAMDLPEQYFLSISRIVPENNIHVILAAFSRSAQHLVYVGNWNGSVYGQSLKAEFSTVRNLYLLDPIYDKQKLDSLRRRAIGCVHGHSVGGTNPALVEAVFWASKILAYDCGFNRATLREGYAYWKNEESLRVLADNIERTPMPPSEHVRALQKTYSWAEIIRAYHRLFNI